MSEIDIEKWREDAGHDWGDPNADRVQILCDEVDRLRAELAKSESASQWGFDRDQELARRLGAEVDRLTAALDRVWGLVCNARKHAGNSYTAQVDALSIERALDDGA